jgi:hypothetical protein
MGVQAAWIARRESGPHSTDEEVVAVVETDMCAVDAIQSLTECTFGKGNLLHHDYGKNAYTFFRRSDGRAIREVGRPDAGSGKIPSIRRCSPRFATAGFAITAAVLGLSFLGVGLEPLVNRRWEAHR